MAMSVAPKATEVKVAIGVDLRKPPKPPSSKDAVLL
jgi:hypothetical protein